MRLVTATVLALLLAGPAAAQRVVPQRLPVAVLTIDEAEPATEHGLTRFIGSEAKGRQDSAKDVLSRLAVDAMVHVRPVREQETPLVTVIVLKREYIEAQDEAHIITARVQAAGATREVTSTNDSWRGSALTFARQLDALGRCELRGRQGGYRSGLSRDSSVRPSIRGRQVKRGDGTDG